MPEIMASNDPFLSNEFSSKASIQAERNANPIYENVELRKAPALPPKTFRKQNPHKGNQNETDDHPYEDVRSRLSVMRGVDARKTNITNKQLLQPKRKDDNLEAVVAIDFGTSASGYAYWLKENPKLDLDRVAINPNWKQSFKCPTCISFRNGKFSGFGYKALEEYMKDDDEEEDDDVTEVDIFNEFKMQLHKQRVDKNMILKSDYVKNGESGEMKAIEVFAMSLKFMQQEFFQLIDNAYPDRIKACSEVMWVVTVPAIWTNEQKYFMREAAYKAGLIETLGSDNLLIALEPECASLFCRTKYKSNERGANLQLGSQYMVVDAGGGTTDISIHKVTDDGRSEEFHEPSGISVGGTDVTKEFERFIEKLLGDEFTRDFKNNYYHHWLELLQNFNASKITVKKDYSNISIVITMGFSQAFLECKKMPFAQYITKIAKEGVSISKNTGKLVLSKKIVEELFKPTISKIMKHLAKILMKLENIKTIFIVGGFGTCAVLQKRIIDDFGKSKTILIPEDPVLGVLKGAVLFGQRPDFVSSRISTLTYALLISRDFDKKNDEMSRREITLGGFYYVQSLSPIVKIGQQLPFNYTKTIETETIDPKQQLARIEIYTSSSQDVEDPKAEGVRKLGNIDVRLPASRGENRRRITVSITFGGTELKVSGTTAAQRVETSLNLLGD